MTTQTFLLQERILAEMCSFIKNYEESCRPSARWGMPLLGFADARHPLVLNLKTLISPAHALPEEVLPDASIVIAYYVPFTKELAKSNVAGRLSSPRWAQAYEETNTMFQALNQHVVAFISTLGYRAAVSKEASAFSTAKLISNWSHRHFAYLAGLGTFGINNMLITPRGCCGRFSSIVTNLPATPSQPMTQELCLYKQQGSCQVCRRNCPVGALTETGYQRQQCYALLRENAAVYTDFGSSYLDETFTEASSSGSEVCGKCVTASPCAFF